MEKKYFEAPYLKVVRVHNDIVTASIGDNVTSKEDIGAPERIDFEEEDY